MSPFRTTLAVPNFPFQINHQGQILSIGSCFAENIGQRLETLKFPIKRNPFGILYNPMSILNALKSLHTGYEFTHKDLITYNGLWHSFWHHSQFSGEEQAAVLTDIQVQATEARKVLKACNRLLITFGTAYVYEHIARRQMVSNCHKIPAKNFQKKRLSIMEILAEYRVFLQELKSRNTDLEIIFTISPIRHIKDGIIENQRSKAVLLLAVEELCSTLDFVHYFPAYEILMDDLRDYRFYGEDMLHPSKVAVDYVWQQFESAFFNVKTLSLNRQIKKLQTGLSHRPFQPESEAHQTFLKKLFAQMKKLEASHPSLNFDSENEEFATKIMLE